MPSSTPSCVASSNFPGHHIPATFSQERDQHQNLSLEGSRGSSYGLIVSRNSCPMLKSLTAISGIEASGAFWSHQRFRCVVAGSQVIIKRCSSQQFSPVRSSPPRGLDPGQLFEVLFLCSRHTSCASKSRRHSHYQHPQGTWRSTRDIGSAVSTSRRMHLQDSRKGICLSWGYIAARQYSNINVDE